jgi:MoxR-like ATPase
MAQALSLQTSRVQCTNELLPSDLLGYVSWDSVSQTSRLVKGPIFTELLMVDELNRAPSKTQSALLEAMEERQVTLDGQTHPLSRHFAVIATQNPREQVGVYSLPESQLDRFSVCISMPAHSRDSLMELLRSSDSGESVLQKLSDMMRGQPLPQAKTAVQSVHVSDSVLAYLLNLTEALELVLSRNLAIRFRKQLLGLCKAYAFLQSRDFVIPDDLPKVMAASLRHRLQGMSKDELDELLAGAFQKVRCP